MISFCGFCSELIHLQKTRSLCEVLYTDAIGISATEHESQTLISACRDVEVEYLILITWSS